MTCRFLPGGGGAVRRGSLAIVLGELDRILPPNGPRKGLPPVRLADCLHV
jgi:hypothetical protein